MDDRDLHLTECMILEGLVIGPLNVQDIVDNYVAEKIQPFYAESTEFKISRIGPLQVWLTYQTGLRGEKVRSIIGYVMISDDQKSGPIYDTKVRVATFYHNWEKRFKDLFSLFKAIPQPTDLPSLIQIIVEQTLNVTENATTLPVEKVLGQQVLSTESEDHDYDSSYSMDEKKFGTNRDLTGEDIRRFVLDFMSQKKRGTTRLGFYYKYNLERYCLPDTWFGWLKDERFRPK